MRSIWRHLRHRKLLFTLLLFSSLFGAYLYSRWPIRGTTADGTTTIELLHVGAGNFDYESDDIVLKTLRKWTPKKLQKYLPQRISLSRRPPLNDAGALKLQLLFSHQETLGPRPGPKAGLRPIFQFIDSAGRVHPGHWDQRSQVMYGFMYFGFDAWPRRDPYLHCRVLNSNDGKPILEFRVRNPDYRPDAPVWAPDTLPAVAKDQDVRVTVNGWRINTSGYAGPQFVIESDDSESDPWRRVSSGLEDATGNCGYGVSATESAWRWKLVVQRFKPKSELRELTFLIAPPEELRQAVNSTLDR